MAAQTVEVLLARAEEEEAEKLRKVTVHKELELQLDLGNLLACDPNPPDSQGRRGAGGAALEEQLRALARDNTQLLVNALWALPTERLLGGEAVLVANLPEPSTRLPREKPPPKPRAPTRWEQFAKLKGIQKRKKTNLVWDELHKAWRRRWGYQRARDDTKEWLIEVPERAADPDRDLFGERAQAKRERVDRNELNRLRNIARSQRGGGGPALPGSGGLAPVPGGAPSKAQLAQALQVARSSTASVGRFQERLPREKEPKGHRGKKRHFQPLIGDLGAERQRQLELLGLMQSKKPRLDVTRAAHKQMREEDQEAASLRRKQPKKGGRGGKGKNAGGKGKGKALVGKRKTAPGKGKGHVGKGRSPGGKRNKK